MLTLRRLATIAFPLILFPVIATALVGFFSRYVADDYCYAAAVASNGFAAAQSYWYITWSGRFSFTLLESIAAWLGNWTALYLPAFLISVWLLIAYFALTKLIPDARIRLFSAFLLVFASLSSAPNLFQSLYWQTGLLTYVLSLLLFTGMLGLFASPKQSAVRLGLMALLAFVAGGLSETYSVFQVTILVAALPFVFRSRFRSRLLVALAGAVCALLIVIASPGNALRQSHFPRPPGLWPLWWMTSENMLSFLFHAVTLSIAVSFLFALALGWSQPNKIDWTFFMAPLIALPAIAVCFAVSAYAMSSALPDRALIVPQFALLLMVVTEGYLLGAYVRRWNVLQNFIPFYKILCAALFVLMVFSGSVSAVLRSLQMQRFSAEWDVRESQVRYSLRSKPDKIVVIPLDEPFDMEAPSDNAASWVNQCMAQYYGVPSLISKQSP